MPAAELWPSPQRRGALLCGTADVVVLRLAPCGSMFITRMRGAGAGAGPSSVYT